MFLPLVSPNKSVCSNSKSLSEEIWFLLLKHVFTYLPIWQASHNFFLFEHNMRGGPLTSLERISMLI
jgi:hypothetical protein